MEQINGQRALTALGETAPTRQSTSSMPPERPVPPVIAEIIAKMAVRYPPSGQADLNGRAERILLLSQDVADVPPSYLEAAVRKLVRESVFMPKASELIAAAREAASIDRERRSNDDTARATLQAHCDRLNSIPVNPYGAGWKWAVVGSPGALTCARIR